MEINFGTGRFFGAYYNREIRRNLAALKPKKFARLIYKGKKHRFEIPFFEREVYYFDAKAASRVCWFFENRLHHVKGKRFFRKPFILEQWQVNFLAQLYGMKRCSDCMRRYREAFLAIPRKNGKSTLAAGIALYGLYGDGEKGAEVYSAAGDTAQAKIIFDIAKSMIDVEPKLMVLSDPQNNIIKMRTTPGTNEVNPSFYKAVSSEAYSKHGLNPSTLVFDEFHTQPNRELWDVYSTAVGSRDQPIIVIITTAGDDIYSICKEKWDEALKIESGEIIDDTILVCIYAIRKDEDWHNPEVWKRVNPCWGKSLRPEYFHNKYAKAVRSSAEAKIFQQLHLNGWVQSYTAWLDMGKWDECFEDFTKEDLKGFKFVGGGDLSSVKDLTALMLVFEKNSLYYLLPFFFMPADTIKDRQKEDKVPYSEWVEQGYIEAVDGNAIDQKLLLDRWIEILRGFKGDEVVMDKWNAEFIMKELEHAGYKVRPFEQTIRNYSPPTKFTETCVLNKRLRHNGNPVLTWCMSNIEVAKDGNGNIKPIKPKGKNKSESKRIDGGVALIMAMAKYLEGIQRPKKSVYDTPGRLNEWNKT